MIALIEMIFGSKVGRGIAEVLLVLGLIGSVALYLEHRGAERELSKLQTSSTQLVAKANAAIKTETVKHAADVKANQEKTDAALKAAHNLSAALDSSVRDFDAYRRAHPDVPRPFGGPGTAGAGECGARDCGDLASAALQDGDKLAGSNAVLSAVLQSCQRDRDSLTGLPR